MADIVSRAEWGAVAPSRRLDRLAHTRGVKVHYTGSHVDVRIIDDHGRCLKLMRDIQRMHMAGGRGEVYSDIGYTVGACCHRQVLIGRGPHILPAANGAGLNSQHYAILALIGNSGYAVPTPGLLHGIRDAIEFLRAHGDAGNEIKGHRDGYKTDCPGDRLYAWIRRGAPRPGGDRPRPAPTRFPELQPGDSSPYVVRIRKALGAVDQTSTAYTAEDPDLMALVAAFKARHKLGTGLDWNARCWANLDKENPS
ncbi:N-acetylmuramoyl-L-alanine amidase [Nonomuraea sp. NPDC050310]|uniref:N-acetylmuramoyl-L-alanine amidase n=1 Tax=Nonomuraea sp. NPDC050310 TaxID=3154935 RepID=UPI003403BDC0